MINSKNPRSNFTKPITNFDYFLQRYSPEKMSDLKKEQLLVLLTINFLYKFKTIKNMINSKRYIIS